MRGNVRHERRLQDGEADLKTSARTRGGGWSHLDTQRCYATHMNARVDHLLHEVLELAPEERSAVAAALVDSLEGDDGAAVSDAWKRELRARRDAYRSGSVKATPWAEARARMSAL